MLQTCYVECGCLLCPQLCGKRSSLQASFYGQVVSRREHFAFVARCSLVVEVAQRSTLAAIGQVITTGATTLRTIAPTASGHAIALMTFTQLAVTAAVAYGACVLPQANADRGFERIDDETTLMFDGVDVSDFTIFREAEVQKAIAYAKEAHAYQMRMTGDPYITHCLHTAKILAALVPSCGKRAIETVIAGVLHDVVDDTERSLKDLHEHFGDDVAKLVAGVSRLSYINQLLRRHRRVRAQGREGNGLSSADIDSLRVMLLGMVNDPRVVLIKLADRLHNMRTIYALPPEKARAVAQETLAVWCSLASRLGIWAVKSELEDLCFAVLQLRKGLAIMWSPRKDWRYLRRITKREKRRFLLYGDEFDRTLDWNSEDEEITIKDLLEAVIPFDILVDRKKRSIGYKSVRNRTKVVRDAEAALNALRLCEDALDKELAISTPYVPGTEITLTGRLKSLHSTHVKMKRKGVPLDQIYDARALRVVVDDQGDHMAAVKGCYSLLHVIHRLWVPIGGEFDDYISNPKPSGYQSLHTAVRGPDGAPLEVQIRTQVMHDQAESGNAAHWLYKESEAAAVTATAVRDEEISPLQPQAKTVQLRHPALRIEGGSVRAAVILRVDDGGKELLVAVSSGEAVAPGMFSHAKQRWEIFTTMYKKVSKSWWCAPGHGDWNTCLEKYVLYSDNIYHKQDQFQRSLPVFLQPLDLKEDGEKEYMEMMMMTMAENESGVEVDEDETDSTTTAATAAVKSHLKILANRTTGALNNKVKLLRSMLQWEKEVGADGSALTEVVVIRWPDGEIVRLPAASTVSDAAYRMGIIEGKFLYVNGHIALPCTELRDGDVIEVRMYNTL